MEYCGSRRSSWWKNRGEALHMLFLSCSMSPIPINGILRSNSCTELDILINEMKLFKGLKCLEVFLLSEEDQKTSGTNLGCHSGFGKKSIPPSKLQWSEEWKEWREKKLTFLFHFISFSVTVTHIISLHPRPPPICS